MSLTTETPGISESNSPNIAESSVGNNSVEIKKLDIQASASNVVALLNSERSFIEETTDSYLNRLQNLRNELNYINETDWMYESLEKKPQQ